MLGHTQNLMIYVRLHPCVTKTSELFQHWLNDLAGLT